MKKGGVYVDEDTINAVDEMLTYDDDEFAAILTTYTEARGALAKASKNCSWILPGRCAC